MNCGLWIAGCGLNRRQTGVGCDCQARRGKNRLPRDPARSLAKPAGMAVSRRKISTIIGTLAVVLWCAMLARAGDDAETSGMALARQLRAQKPAQEVHTSGVLRIRDAQGKRTEIPIRFDVILHTNSWWSLYEVQGSVPNLKQKILVIHSPEQTNQYFLVKPNTAGSNPPDRIPLGDADLFQSFGGSDFWVADLGLEFLHWPKQRLVKTEMRRGRSCRVLESLALRSEGLGYDRVLSWVDIETGGIVRAEAYRENQQLIKEFSLRSIKKGQLKEIQLRNTQTDSVTRLEFDLDLEGVPGEE